MQPIIELDHVSFRFASQAEPALSDVSLAIEEGSFVGVIGPSGAGKSTLAAALSGAIPHHHKGALFGAVRIAGADTCEVSLTDIARTVGSVAQDIDAQMVAAVVEDEMLYGLENFGIDHALIEGRLQEALDTVGIAELRHREIATLSGGQKQKVAIAAILALKPRVLVLDEPTAALDPVSAQMVFDTLRAINREAGVTVVVVEQMVAMLSRYCDRVVVMSGGRIALEGAPREVFAHADELRRIGVDSPRVARVSNSLAAEGLVEDGSPCLDVDEAAALIEGLVGDRARGRGGAAGERGGAAGERGGRDAGRAGETVLELRGVCFAYPRGGAAVTDLSLTVRRGEIVAIVGQNGAGKTTVTKLINGLLKPARGSVRVAGADTREVPVSAIAAHVATLFQNPDRQICKNTVLDEVSFGLELHGIANAARGRAEAVIERFGLPAGASPFALSRGQRQMVALASLVVLEPRLVLLDEPTSGLDYRECMTVMETVRDMASRGCAVVMVCHDMEVVSDFADRLVVMADGRILADGDAGAVFANDGLMRRASIAPPQVVALSQRLARSASPAFDGISEVSDLVATCKELTRA